jgi:glucokinase
VEPRYLLGLDIGGTKILIALADADGQIVAESRFRDWTSGDAAADLAMIAGEIGFLLENAKVGTGQVRCLGVSAAGPLDIERGVVIDAPNVAGWREVPVVESLSRALSMPVRLENDANAAALAEWRHGAGRGVDDLIFLTMSTGVGAGLILGGRLYRGARFQAGEVGHMPIVSGGRPCSCGLRGCLEAYVGGAALAARMRQDAARGEARAILELAGGDPRRIDARHWVDAIRSGVPYALALREEFLDHLAHGLAILVLALDPRRVLLGTLVRENPDLFLDSLRERLRARLWPPLQDVEIEAAALGPRLPAYAGLSVAALGLPGSGE